MSSSLDLCKPLDDTTHDTVLQKRWTSTPWTPILSNLLLVLVSRTSTDPSLSPDRPRSWVHKLTIRYPKSRELINILVKEGKSLLRVESFFYFFFFSYVEYNPLNSLVNKRNTFDTEFNKSHIKLISNGQSRNLHRVITFNLLLSRYPGPHSHEVTTSSKSPVVYSYSRRIIRTSLGRILCFVRFNEAKRSESSGEIKKVYKE